MDYILHSCMEWNRTAWVKQNYMWWSRTAGVKQNYRGEAELHVVKQNYRGWSRTTGVKQNVRDKFCRLKVSTFRNLRLSEQLGQPRKLWQSIATLTGSTRTGGPVNYSPTATRSSRLFQEEGRWCTTFPRWYYCSVITWIHRSNLGRVSWVFRTEHFCKLWHLALISKVIYYQCWMVRHSKIILIEILLKFVE